MEAPTTTLSFSPEVDFFFFVVTFNTKEVLLIRSAQVGLQNMLSGRNRHSNLDWSFHA